MDYVNSMRIITESVFDKYSNQHIETQKEIVKRPKTLEMTIENEIINVFDKGSKEKVKLLKSESGDMKVTSGVGPLIKIQNLEFNKLLKNYEKISLFNEKLISQKIEASSTLINSGENRLFSKNLPDDYPDSIRSDQDFKEDICKRWFYDEKKFEFNFDDIKIMLKKDNVDSQDVTLEKTTKKNKKLLKKVRVKFINNCYSDISIQRLSFENSESNNILFRIL